MRDKQHMLRCWPLTSLSNPFGVFLYLILRNDISWSLLSPEDKNLILTVNRSFNAERDDYANPEQYGTGRVEGGENWDSTASRDATTRGKSLLSALQRIQPRNVLEVGPGPGFFTRSVAEHSSVESYTGIDVGTAFLHYLRPRLTELASKKFGFTFNLLHGDLKEQTVNQAYDFMVVLSCVHHIPDRNNFFSLLETRLTPGGHIFCFDPSHYLVRWTRIIRAVFSQKWLSPQYFMKRENLSTHHFCTAAEYARILKKIPNLEIVEEYYVPANRVKRWSLLVRLFPRLLSVEMGVLLRKKQV